ncbi:hypothetical protein PN462_07475 [Spirulina sp. CS-785/01]|uniref:hypothetical protein n=1 Tax=Spirulina sp. CS-785/01 TaxID=3021716 RepID=UPI00232D84B0|nr:hypothetical protein [Spirulina sp. CS-785/01]MDB9312936.1 hypothetical protein [Spirulina sp. CS-785/01]
MSQILDAHQLTLKQVQQDLQMQANFVPDLSQYLTLEPLTQTEALHNLQHLAESYYLSGRLLEGQVKLLLVSPLLWLAGFYTPEIEILLEEKIAEIYLEDQDIVIRGRMDILALSRTPNLPNFWILLIETKNAAIDTSAGLPQLLTYGSTGLTHQNTIWGLVTNGIDYQFVQLQGGEPKSYRVFPKLSLLYLAQAEQVLQVLQALVTV